MADIENQIKENIKIAIQSFDSSKLYESAIRFFNVLDYKSDKTDRIKPTNFDGFLDAFNISTSSVNKEKALASHWKKIEFIFQVADSEITRIQSLFDTGEVDINEYQSFLFFAIQLKEETYKRSDLVKITREVNLPFKMPVIVLFHYGNKLTLAVIDRRLHKRDTNKDVLEKVTVIKDIDITQPQRAHIEILYDLSIDSLYKQFEFHSFAKLHEAWRATLNVSELNKKFYRELAYWYFWAVDEVKFPADEMKDKAVRNPVNVIRLITRLIFVWFLKEKNLIPDELFNKPELDKILDYKDKTGSTYYKAILQNLFFATLNTEMNKDVKDKEKISRTFVKRNTGVPHYFRYTRFIKQQDKFEELMDNIPFLNGGLFECLDKRYKDSTKDVFIDGFSQQLKNESQLQVPDYLFFSDDYKEIDLNETFHTSGKKYKVRGLINILNNYKFTIEENTPIEEEIALDPDLLGIVFESLLASYNPETQATARKQTGSFYTPREIVNYMVDESLKEYLKSKLAEKNVVENVELQLQQLFSYSNEAHKFSAKEISVLIEAINNLKILDPACGSGAFPMGILQKLVFILNKLDPNNKLWKQQQYEKAKRDELLAEKMEDEKNREAAVKEIEKRKEDIEKAFDSNNHELDFARKLFLIENCIYGVDIQPIAIQIAKLRFFIALIVDQKSSGSLKELNRGVRPLPNLETKFVAANSLKAIDKSDQLSFVNLFLEKEIDILEKELHDIRERHFRARTPDTKEKYRLRDKELREQLANMLEEAGLFSPAIAKKVAHWNPYDQNAKADFFDAQWMFEVDDCFDIVIGNPPYKVVTKKEQVDYKGYSTIDIGDLYAYFYERSIKDLLKKNGSFAFITASLFIKGMKFEKLRNFLTENLKLIYLNLQGDKAFNNVQMPTVVLIGTKSSKKNNEWSFEDYIPNFKVLEGIERETIPLSNISGVMRGWEIGRDKVQTKGSIKIITGSDVEKWRIKEIGFVTKEIEKEFSKQKEYFDGERILIRETGSELLALYLEEKIYCNRSLYSIKLKTEKYSPKYITALLNSRLFQFYYEVKFKSETDLFPKIRIGQANQLPIRPSTKELQSVVSSIVDFIILLKNSSEDVIPDTQNFIVSDYFEQVLNGCVYELYFEAEMKKAGVQILELVARDLEGIKKLSKEKAIAKIYELWQKQKNEVRERLLLMATRCPDTIGIIEDSVK